MREPPRTLTTSLLGWLMVILGSGYLFLALAAAWKGNRLETTDGLLTGGIAFILGCVILRRRERPTSDAQAAPAPAEPGLAEDLPREG